MGEQYGFSPELRRLTGGNAHFPTELRHRDDQHALLATVGRGFAAPAPAPMDAFGLSEGGGGCSGRWPRQETLTLLEVRSRLDSKFREAVHKASLWEQVSRIMADEHGYQRSGKKCKEKLENLYKYYKKTREGKAGRQDGKHYRFFRQLDALYGENTNLIADSGTAANSPYFEIGNTSNAQANQEAFQPHGYLARLGFSNSTDFDSSSTSEGDEDDEDLSTIAAFQTNQMSGKKTISTSRKSWRLKIREFVDSQLMRFMESQEAWFDKMLKALECMEQQRVSREEAWRKQEAARVDQENKIRGDERAWTEARDAALIAALARISRRITNPPSPEELACSGLCRKSCNYGDGSARILQDDPMTTEWPVAEITSLTNLRMSMESKFQRCHDLSNEVLSLWDEISAAMACLGYTRSAKSCKEKWECMKFLSRMEQEKKEKRSSKECSYYQHLDFLYNHGGEYSDSQGDDDDPPFQNNDLQCNLGTTPINSFHD